MINLEKKDRDLQFLISPNKESFAPLEPHPLIKYGGCRAPHILFEAFSRLMHKTRKGAKHRETSSNAVLQHKAIFDCLVFVNLQLAQCNCLGVQGERSSPYCLGVFSVTRYKPQSGLYREVFW